jgi:ankyrin repeat protein
MIAAASAGDVPALQSLLNRKPELGRPTNDYQQPIHFAARAGHLDAVRLLLNAGADPEWNSSHDVSLIEMARERGYEEIARLLEQARDLRGRSPVEIEPIDRALAGSDVETIRLLVNQGATCDLTIAAALGDRDRILALLDPDPASIASQRSSGRRPLHTAIEFGHVAIARLLLDRGADPTRDSSLHTAASRGDLDLVKILLAHGADPNAHAFCAGNALYAAKTEEIRALLKRHGAKLDPYDLVWMGKDDEVLLEIEKDPASAERGCGGVFTAVCTRGNKKLLMRLLDAGVPVPSVAGGCRSYLLENLEMLPILLDHGMSPDLPDWQGQTFLHSLCRSGESIERAAILLDAGAALSPREEEYNSTPLAWAARNNNREMLEFLLARGAPITLPDDKPWSTPLAWALRRGHTGIAALLTERSSPEKIR